MLDEATISRIAAAIDAADVNYSLRLTRLVEGISTYTLTLDGATEEFVDNDEAEAIDQAHARLRNYKQRKQAEAVIAALEHQPKSPVQEGDQAQFKGGSAPPRVGSGFPGNETFDDERGRA